MAKMKHQILRILPVGWDPKAMMELQIDAKDWIPFENSEFNLEEPYKAPLMKNMPPNYRLKLVPTVKDSNSLAANKPKRLIKE